MTFISILRSCMNYMIAYTCVLLPVLLVTATLNLLFNAHVELHETAAFAALAFAVRNK